MDLDSSHQRVCNESLCTVLLVSEGALKQGSPNCCNIPREWNCSHTVSAQQGGSETLHPLFMRATSKLYQLGLKMGCKILCGGFGDGAPYDFLCGELRPVTDE